VILEARRDVLAEKTRQRGHAPVSHSATRAEFAARCAQLTSETWQHGKMRATTSASAPGFCRMSQADR
jgi:hypothetical protein